MKQSTTTHAQINIQCILHHERKVKKSIDNQLEYLYNIYKIDDVGKIKKKLKKF